MSSYRKVHQTYDGLYDNVRGDKEDFMDEDSFRIKVEELVEDGYIETSILDDLTIYSAKHGLKWWSDFVQIDDAVKKSILLLLVVNPTTFFVLQNTQKGKMKIAALEIKRWGQDRTKKVVAFIVVGNDKTLADQSVDGIQKTFGDQKVRIFFLSSNSKTTFDEIKTYIDAYASDVVEEGKEPEYPMPIIALLGNLNQCEKKLRLQYHIHKKVINRNSLLRYGEIWDEADRTYKQLRDKPLHVEGQMMTCRTFTVEHTDALYRLGFISATDGNLLDEDYPECANAYLYPIEIAPEDQLHYRALHHPEAITHRVPVTTKNNNNAYAMQILSDEANLAHFNHPIILSSGESYYRKIIVNSNAKTEDMKQFAKWCNTTGKHAIVFNGYGGASVKVYRYGSRVETHKTKGKMFSELLFYIYKKLNLHDKPLVIIGRRKVDRGLGFHYCPRKNDEVFIEGSLGPLSSVNKEGLVWTDAILGRIEDKDTAVQKAGRLAGIIGGSPQYPGETHYWTDEYTENLIRRHNTIVDNSNGLSDGCSILQAVMEAEKMTPAEIINHRVDMETFLVYTDEETVRKVCATLHYEYRSTKPSTTGPNIGFRETSLNTKKNKVTLLDAIKKVPTAYGSNNNVTTWRVCYPCYKDIDDKESLHFVIIIRPDVIITGEKNSHSEQQRQIVAEIRKQYPDIIIPQEGAF